MKYKNCKEVNLELSNFRKENKDFSFFKDYCLNLKTLNNEEIQEVVVFFSDIEGKFHHLEYDYDFFVNNNTNLMFDGSSVEGFSSQNNSDLKLKIDWTSGRLFPEYIFGSLKLSFFAFVEGSDNLSYLSDLRYRLYNLASKIKEKDGYIFNLGVEIEGFLFQGLNAEQNFTDEDFKLCSNGGYFNSVARDELKLFCSKFFNAIRDLGFKNEKYHPEVAPSQFEVNYKYSDVLESCDNVQLYKFIARQIGYDLGLTVSFLPKPISNINGSGMHLNISIEKNGKNLFYDKNNGISNLAEDFIQKILSNAKGLCLILNSSVNSYRRLDPHFEAPNEIKVSKIDRSAMIRIPMANESSSRIEIRSVSSDANPYLVMFVLINICEKQINNAFVKDKTDFIEKLPSNITDAIFEFKKNSYIKDILTEEVFEKFLKSKTKVADRSPKILGKNVKIDEIIYHHEIRNQEIWDNF